MIPAASFDNPLGDDLRISLDGSVQRGGEKGARDARLEPCLPLAGISLRRDELEARSSSDIWVSGGGSAPFVSHFDGTSVGSWEPSGSTTDRPLTMVLPAG